MWQTKQRRRHTAGEDNTDPDTVMEPLVKAMKTVRISVKQDGEEEQEQEQEAVEKHPGEEESEVNVTMGG